MSFKGALRVCLMLATVTAISGCTAGASHVIARQATSAATPIPVINSQDETSPASSSTAAPSPSPNSPSTPKPTPTEEAQPWTTAYVQIDGFSVKYPNDWLIIPATRDQRVTQILSWQPTGPGGMDGVGKGQILIQIATTSGPIPNTGQPISVTQSNLSGVMVPGGTDDVQPAETIRRVYYQVQGTEWLVTGYFGDPATDSNPNLPIFLRILKSINHTNSPAPILTPAPTPTPMPSPTPTAAPLPYEYLHPRGALLAAGGQLGVTIYSYVLDKADLLPLMFHLASVDVGDFNLDPNQFYPWLLSWVSENYGLTHPAEGWQAHFDQQIQAVFYEPDSPAAQILRLMAASSGYQVYWDYVLLPRTFNDVPGTIIDPVTFSKNVFDTLVGKYLNALSSDPNTPTFDIYLGRTDYLEKFFGITAP